MNSAMHLANDSLNTWLDQELSADERAVVEAHLAACVNCRREAEELAALKSALGTLPQHQPPRSFQLSPDQARKAQPASAPAPLLRLLPVTRVLSIAAVMAFMIVSGALLYGPVTSGGETDRAADSSLSVDEPEVAGAPGEIVDQGQAAVNDSETLNVLVPTARITAPAPLAISDTANAETGEAGRSPLELTAIGLGMLSLVLVGAWILLARQFGTRPVRSSVSGIQENETLHRRS